MPSAAAAEEHCEVGTDGQKDKGLNAIEVPAAVAMITEDGQKDKGQNPYSANMDKMLNYIRKKSGENTYAATIADSNKQGN